MKRGDAWEGSGSCGKMREGDKGNIVLTSSGGEMGSCRRKG